MVYCLYPETNQRSLEEIDLLFTAETPWVWDAEKNFARLKAENPDIAGTGLREKGGEVAMLEEGRGNSDVESVGAKPGTEKVESS